jgi:type IV pilus assembly protein PilV
MKRTRTPRRSPRRLGLRGVGLIDALIAIAILSFGLIGMTRMQGRMVSASTDAQLRTVAMQKADELLNTVLVDNANAPCYTLPAAGACGSPVAAARAVDWATDLATAMWVPATPTVTLDAGTGRMTVQIEWTSREGADPRQLRVVTDVR